MKVSLSNLFRWQPTGETLMAFIAGIVAIALSAAMLPFYPHLPWRTKELLTGTNKKK